jgi:hypothetical protein
LPLSDPVLGISHYVVSTLIKNIVLIGYFAKILLKTGILAYGFSRVIFVTVSAIPNWSEGVTIASQMPSMARQIDHVGENG